MKCILVQLLRAVRHVHALGYVHRDIKMSNLLYRNGNVKLGDFGLARPCSPGSGRYSSRVVTLWFRAPELLLGSTTYGPALDMWSVGCVAAELLLGRPLFPAESELEATVLIARLLGPPTPGRFPEVAHLPLPPAAAMSEGRASVRRSLARRMAAGRPAPRPRPAAAGAAREPLPDAFDDVFPRLGAEGLAFLRGLLQYSPAGRMTAEQALEHPYLTRASPAPADPADMPFCRDQIVIDAEIASAGGRHRRVIKPGAGADPTDNDPARKAPALIAASAASLALHEGVAASVDAAMSEWDAVEAAVPAAAAAARAAAEPMPRDRRPHAASHAAGARARALDPGPASSSASAWRAIAHGGGHPAAPVAAARPHAPPHPARREAHPAGDSRWPHPQQRQGGGQHEQMTRASGAPSHPVEPHRHRAGWSGGDRRWGRDDSRGYASADRDAPVGAWGRPTGGWDRGHGDGRTGHSAVGTHDAPGWMPHGHGNERPGPPHGGHDIRGWDDRERHRGATRGRDPHEDGWRSGRPPPPSHHHWQSRR